MPDHFATLDQPRRPWLDPEALRECFHRAAAQHHPDAAGGGDERFAALNAAYATLREPAPRLRHLMELAAPDLLARPAVIPPALGDLFMQLAARRRAAETFLQKRSAASSPLARALLAAEQSALRLDLDTALAQLTTSHDTALAELRALDTAWPSHTPADLETLATLQARFAFLAKWTAQLREDLFKLGA